MRVLIVTGIYPPEIGGSATYSALLARELPKRGFEVMILTYSAFSSPLERGRVGVGDGIVYVSRRWPKGLRHLIFLFKLIFLAREQDLVLAADSSFGAATTAAIACRLVRKKFIVRVTGDYAWEQGVQRFGVKDLIDEFQTKKYSWHVDFLRWAQKFAVKSATIVIAPSEYLRGLAIGWGASPEKVRVIYNAVDLPATPVIARSPDALVGTTRQSYTIVSAGRLVPWKGFEVLIEAVSELRQEIPEIKLVIVGSGPNSSSLRGLAKQSHNNVILIDSLPKTELAQKIKSADIFILNTAYEGFSHQIVEAMSLGVPVVTTSVGGNPEIIKDGKNGLLVGYNDKEAIKQAILRLYKDRDLAARLGAAAATSARQYSVEAMMVSLTRLL